MNVFGLIISAPIMLGVVGAPALATHLAPAPAGVRVTSEYGTEFVTIGDAGNRPTRAEELRFDPRWVIGDVSYEYRMARTEVTVGQWLEFVLAYDRFNEPPRVNNAFHGHGVTWDFAGQQWYTTLPLDYPTTMSWDYAARYVNWLHNDKALAPEAFERGAYDTSTFTYNPDGTSNYQESHSPGARFWIPSHDEWVKAVYWDPQKNNGEGGYWYYPGASDEALLSGPPGVGQTNAGENGDYTPVGSYPEAQGPWGLFDASGGVREWSEEIRVISVRTRYQRGTYAGQDLFWDALDASSASFPTASLFSGVRVAAAIPSSGGVTLAVFLVSTRRRSRR